MSVSRHNSISWSRRVIVESTQLSHNRHGKDKKTLWDKLKKDMGITFIPYNFKCTLFQKFYNIWQGSCSVENYANEFYQMLTRVEIHELENQLDVRFIAGLHPQLQKNATPV